MEASNGNSLQRKRKFLVDEEDANILTFRRRNKIIAVVFILLIISLSLFIAALIIHLRRYHDPIEITQTNPIVEFCKFSSAPTCSTTLSPIIAHKLIIDPNQIFALSLQTAANRIQFAINTSLTDTPNFTFNNCSNSLRGGLGRIRESLATMRVNPFVESLSDQQRVEMNNRIVAAEEDVESCLDDLAQVERPESAAEMTAELVDVQVYLICAGDFVDGYPIKRRLLLTQDIVFISSIVSGNLMFMCGLQLLFIFGLFCSLFRVR